MIIQYFCYNFHKDFSSLRRRFILVISHHVLHFEVTEFFQKLDLFSLRLHLTKSPYIRSLSFFSNKYLHFSFINTCAFHWVSVKPCHYTVEKLIPINSISIHKQAEWQPNKSIRCIQTIWCWVTMWHHVNPLGLSLMWLFDEHITPRGGIMFPQYGRSA